MPGWPILSILTFLPIIGALFVLAIRGEDEVAEFVAEVLDELEAPQTAE